MYNPAADSDADAAAVNALSVCAMLTPTHHTPIATRTRTAAPDSRHMVLIYWILYSMTHGRGCRGVSDKYDEIQLLLEFYVIGDGICQKDHISLCTVMAVVAGRYWQRYGDVDRRSLHERVFNLAES